MNHMSCWVSCRVLLENDMILCGGRGLTKAEEIRYADAQSNRSANAGTSDRVQTS